VTSAGCGLPGHQLLRLPPLTSSSKAEARVRVSQSKSNFSTENLRRGEAGQGSSTTAPKSRKSKVPIGLEIKCLVDQFEAAVLST